MKSKLVYTVFLTSMLFGCGVENSFEGAFNPYTGSKDKANAWRDQGGLDKQSSFYGVSVVGISYRFQPNGMLDNVTMTVESGTSPEAMRKALSKACKAQDDQFVRVPNYPRGSVWLFPNGSSPVLGTTYDLNCTYGGDTRKLYIFSSMQTTKP